MKSASDWSSHFEQAEFSELMFTHKQWDHIVAAIQADALEAAALWLEQTYIDGWDIDAGKRAAAGIRKLKPTGGE